MAKFTAEQLLNHLYNNRLPHVYREADVDTKYSLKRFLQSMIEGGFTEAITSADGIVDLTDPLKCPDNLFPYLFKSFGYTYSADIPLIYQRKILQNHGELFQKRGTLEYIYILTRILTGFECDVNIERVNGVRLLTVTMFVDNSVTSVESQYYVTLVKRFIKVGYIPFYLDVATNIVVDVVDVITTGRYIASAVGVEGIINLSPIEEVSDKGIAISLSPSLDKEPFTKFNILGYSKIVPRYDTKNIINPNTLTTNTSVSWVDPDTKKMTTLSSVDLYTDFLYIPYGSKLYFALFSPLYQPPTVYTFVYNSYKELLGVKIVTSQLFQNGKATLSLSDLLVGTKCETDYYVRMAVLDNEGIAASALSSLMGVYFEEISEFEAYNAGTRLKFDNEYFKNGQSYPVYTVDIYDSNGPMGFPYCSTKEFELDTGSNLHRTGMLTMRKTASASFVAFTDCTTAMKDDHKYYISFIMDEIYQNPLSSPIVTALCNNGKGTLKEVVLTKEVGGYDNNTQTYRYGYSFTVPKDYNVVRIKYELGDSVQMYEKASIYNIMCFECDPDTGNPLIECEFQPYELAIDLNNFKNNLTIGVEGIQLLSYNSSNGKVIVRDSFDVLTGILTHRVGVNYDSLGNPISTFALNVPYEERIYEDYNGAVSAVPVSTFRGKTYVSMSQSVPNSRFEENGGSDYHSCVEITTRIIK